ncbi:hypothetical protein AOLI_G00238910 [Acnodon oligacanthus]
MDTSSFISSKIKIEIEISSTITAERERERESERESPFTTRLTSLLGEPQRRDLKENPPPPALTARLSSFVSITLAPTSSAAVPKVLKVPPRSACSTAEERDQLRCASKWASRLFRRFPGASCEKTALSSSLTPSSSPPAPAPAAGLLGVRVSSSPRLVPTSSRGDRRRKPRRETNGRRFHEESSGIIQPHFFARVPHIRGGGGHHLLLAPLTGFPAFIPFSQS